MKQFLIIVISLLVISGCSSNWYIQKAKYKCPECFELDTTINEIVFKMDTIIKIDTNILIFLPTDTVKIDTVIKKLRPYSFKPIHSKNGIINVKISMTKGVLSVHSYLDSTILYHFKDEILIRDALITKLRREKVKQTVIIKEQKKTLKSYLKRFRVGIVIIISLVVLGIGVRFYRWIKK